MNVCAAFVSERLKTEGVIADGFGPLSVHESINGVAGVPYIDALKWTTSGGFGFPGAKARYFDGEPTERVMKP